VLALGLLLLALGSVVSLYLGLLMTRGLGWLETVLGIGTMGMLIATAASIGLKAPDLLTASVLEGVLAALALLYRTMARARWDVLDWRVCRNDLSARAR
jgi:hypothetical protein